MNDRTTHIYLNPVRADRAEDFERFLSDVVRPATASLRPHLVGRWQLLKATNPEPADAGVITYALIFDGGDLDEDWDLAKILPAHYGDDEADRLLEEWSSTFASYQSWIAALGEQDDDFVQIGWSFRPAMGGPGDAAEHA